MRDKILEAFETDKNMEEFFDFDSVVSWNSVADNQKVKIEIESNRDILKILNQKAEKAGVSLQAYIKLILAERAGVA